MSCLPCTPGIVPVNIHGAFMTKLEGHEQPPWEYGVLDKAKELVDGRDKQDHYGPPEESMRRIGQIWSGILGMEVSAEKVALMMLGLKAARLSIDPRHVDSLIDAAGYVRILERLSK